MPKREPLEIRFWRKVNKEGALWTDPDTGEISHCWEWTASLRRGYGQIGSDYNAGTPIVVLPAHRAGWIIGRGEIPPGLDVLHRCDNPKCVNYEKHLFIGTVQENHADMVAKGRGYWQKNPQRAAEIMRYAGTFVSKENRKEQGARWSRYLKDHIEIVSGERSHFAKLTNEIVLAMRAEYPAKSIKRIADERKMPISTVSLIINRSDGNTFKGVSYENTNSVSDSTHGTRRAAMRVLRRG